VGGGVGGRGLVFENFFFLPGPEPSVRGCVCKCNIITVKWHYYLCASEDMFPVKHVMLISRGTDIIKMDFQSINL
jgi:hypothetical protein